MIKIYKKMTALAFSTAMALAAVGPALAAENTDLKIAFPVD